MTPYAMGLLLGAGYLVIGVLFGALAGAAATHDTRVLWRLAAWAASAVLYLAHIGYLRLHLGHPVRWTAWQAASAAALGAFGLAVAGPARMALAGAHHGPGWILALVLWPLITGVPAFLVALAVAAVLSRWLPSAAATAPPGP